MSILVFQHHPDEDAGRLGRTLRDDGHRLRVVRLDQGQPVPADLDDVDGLVVMGGPMSANEPDRHPWMPPEIDYIRQAHERGRPVVGVCLGAQLIAKALGGDVATMDQPEIGWIPIEMAFPGTINTILSGLPWRSVQFHLHEDEVTNLPPGGVALAGSTACRHQAFCVGMKTYAFQYHFEWTRDDIQKMLGTPFVKQQAGDTQSLISQMKEHYDSYRRLGDRLCRNIATYLMPLDKR
ncbi:MAG: type 1 glutamine amidotransferase [Phycisphaeraceae bacterium]|nr:type 1 glutamine amidotransferase [Phycisphaeraceae bacterium]